MGEKKLEYHLSTVSRKSQASTTRRVSPLPIQPQAASNQPESSNLTPPTQVTVQAAPRLPVSSPLRQKTSNSRLNLSQSSPRQGALDTPTPPSPSYSHSASGATHTATRTSWLSGTSSLSLPHGHTHALESSPAASSRLSISTTGESIGGSGTFPAAPVSARRRIPVSAPFMFPIRSAPSPTHSVSVLSPALLDVPFAPRRSAPSPQLPAQRTSDTMSDIVESFNGSTSTVTATPGMASAEGSEMPPAKRPRVLWPSSWGLSRALGKFRSRGRHERSQHHPPPPSAASSSHHSSGSTQCQVAPQNESPSTNKKTLGIRKSLKNMRGAFRTTAPHQNSCDTLCALNNSTRVDTEPDRQIHSPPPTPNPRLRDAKGRTNKILSVVGELGEGGSAEENSGCAANEGNIGETEYPMVQASNRLPGPSGQSQQGKYRRLNETVVPKDGLVEIQNPPCDTPPVRPPHTLSIRRSSVVGYIYPCNYCTRSWLEECACASNHPGPEPNLKPEDELQTKLEPAPDKKNVTSRELPRPVEPSRRNSRFSELLEDPEVTDTSQTPPIPPPVSSTPERPRGFLSRHGNRGLSGDSSDRNRGEGRSFSWSHAGLSTPRPSSSPSVSKPPLPPRAYTEPSINPPRTPTRKLVPPGIFQQAHSSPSIQFQPPPPPPSPSPSHFNLPPEANAVLGITPAALSARRPRVAATNSPHYHHQHQHQRQSSASSAATASTQNQGASLRLWSSRQTLESEHGIVVVDRGSGIGRGRVSLRSVASVAGSGIATGVVEGVEERDEEMDPVKDRERVRRGLVALGLLNEEVVERAAEEHREEGVEEGISEKKAEEEEVVEEGEMMDLRKEQQAIAEATARARDKGWKGSWGRVWRR